MIYLKITDSLTDTLSIQMKKKSEEKNKENNRIRTHKVIPTKIISGKLF